MITVATFTDNGTSPANGVGVSAGLWTVTVEGSLGGGTVTLAHKGMGASEWSSITAGEVATATALSVTSANQSFSFPVGSGHLRATLSGATTPNCSVVIQKAM